MSIRLTGGVDLWELAQWCLIACDGAADAKAEVYVNPHGWMLRVEGLPDFVIEPDDVPLSTTDDFSLVDALNQEIQNMRRATGGD